MPWEELVNASRAISKAVTDLSAAGVPSPRVDAELLAAHVLGVARTRLPLAGAFDRDQLNRFRALVARRAGREPLQYLLGTAAFRHLELRVGPGVFVPRPETEVLVEWGLRHVGDGLVVDLCSGSGAVALAVAQECPDARVYAVERDPAALEWLRRNAADRAAAGDRRVRVVAADATDPAVLSTLDGTVDLVLCNPPYVPAGTAVPAEVGEYDPAQAVFAGSDGLDTIGPIITRAATLLRPGGWLGIEHDDGHASAVPALLRQDGRYRDIADHTDLGGRPRFTVARLAGCKP
jgi:release factor glutamine methyltransferase